jgi:antitoxin FitA
MAKMIQIRNVPDDLHRKLKIRAIEAGTSLSDYLLGEVRRIAQLPTLQEMQQRLRQLGAVEPRVPPAKVVREERDRR